MSDIEPKVDLGVLDPGRHEPGYWTRFHSRVMEAVEPQLALRRLSPATVGDALVSWGRLVVPFAAAAAAVAVMMFARGPQVDELANVAGLEELLHGSTAGGESLPSFLYRDMEVDRDMVLLAVEEF